MTFCTVCGKPMPSNAKFCSACGTPVPGVAVFPAAGDDPADTDPSDADPISETTASADQTAHAEARSEPVVVCTNCRQPLDPGAETCGACGSATNSPTESPTTVTDSHPTSNSKNSALIGVLAVAGIAVVAVAAWFVWQQVSANDSDAVVVAASTTTTPTVGEDSSETSSTTSTTSATTTTAQPTTTTTLPEQLIADLESTGLFVEPGSTADPASLQASVALARSQGLELSVVALVSEPAGGATETAQAMSAALDLPTVLVVAPGVLGGANQDDRFYPEEFTRARDRVPAGSTEDEAVASFVRSVLGGPDSVGVVSPLSAQWLLLLFDGTQTEFEFGTVDDIALAGDWNCDGITTPGVFRPATGEVFLRNANSGGATDVAYTYNVPDSVPIAGDFNGDGCDTVSFRRSSDAVITVFDTMERATNAPDEGAEYAFGDVGDTAFSGDFDGDGVDTIGLYRPSTRTFYLRNSHAAGPADVEFIFGDPGDIPIAGDWTDQDGIDSVAVYRPTAGTFFFRYTNTAGEPDETLEIELTEMLAVAGSFGLDRSD